MHVQSTLFSNMPVQSYQAAYFAVASVGYNNIIKKTCWEQKFFWSFSLWDDVSLSEDCK